MSSTAVYLAIAGLTLATVLTRSSLLLASAQIKLPARLENALRYAPACALAGIVAPEIFVVRGELVLTVLNPRLLAACAGTAVFLATRNVLATIVAGMGALWVLTAVLG